MMITHFGQFGTNDFIEYWTAFRLFISHQNTYDPQLMLDLQQQLGRHTNTPLMMWNPPWLLVIMAPVLMLGFGELTPFFRHFSTKKKADLSRKLYPIRSARYSLTNRG